MNIKKMTLSAMFTALIAVGAFLKIPMPIVPFSLQFLFVVLAGMLLPQKYGLLSVIVYIALGCAGLPVFANGGGLGYILHPTFGFLLGFLGAAAVCGTIMHHFKCALSPMIGGIAAIVCMYAIALPYLYIILTYVMDLSITIKTLFTSYCFVFLPGDLFSVGISTLLYRRLSPLI